MKNILLVGAGAAGYFAALRAAEVNPNSKITIIEAGSRPLQKVEISGGGRCNVTQGCFEISELLKAYPRGSKELRGAFSRFQAKDTVEWFEERGIKLKKEADGRVFPVTDKSKTIINCFENERKKHKIELLLNTKLKSLKKEKKLIAELRFNDESRHEEFDTVLLATGGSKSGYEIAKDIGHEIEPLAPSLFTFEVNDKRLENLSGVSVTSTKLRLSLPDGTTFKDSGPLLITHWGFSGPAVIRLSAWAARELLKSDYNAELIIDWGGKTLKDEIEKARKELPKKLVKKSNLLPLPKRLWENLCEASGISDKVKFSELSRKMQNSLEKEIYAGSYKITGKGVFKEEFVTCGGVRLKEVDFRTMESKLVSGLYFAGEILDIDGITGGYNFQSAWTTGFIAGSAIGK